MTKRFIFSSLQYLYFFSSLPLNSGLSEPSVKTYAFTPFGSNFIFDFIFSLLHQEPPKSSRPTSYIKYKDLTHFMTVLGMGK